MTRTILITLILIASATATTPQASSESSTNRLLLSTPQFRLEQLEQLGQVPTNANNWDWDLARRTTWWGRRLDPHAFWKGRVVWLDETVASLASRQGRRYPPIPPGSDLAPFAGLSSEDYPPRKGGGFGDYTERDLRASHLEAAFWDAFTRKNPKPPEQLERRQIRAADVVVRLRHRLQIQGKQYGVRPQDIERMSAAERDRAAEEGYPSEAFTDDALYWACVLDERREYQKLVGSGSSPGSVRSKSFFSRLVVDVKHVTEPLTADQLGTAAAWKLAYLQRLRREKVAESYINAYLGRR